jgi:hypothetical protein
MTPWRFFYARNRLRALKNLQNASLAMILSLKKILKAYFTTLRTDFVDFYFLKIVFLTFFQTQNEAKRNVHPSGFEPNY